MFQVVFVVFREFLEVALLLGVVMAVTRNIKHSRTYIMIGMMLGVIGSSLLAFVAGALSESMGGLGDEVFDSIIILLTVVIIGWTVIWMQGYGARLKENLRTLSSNIDSGVTSRFTLTLVVAVTILREGAEIILIIYGLVAKKSADINDYILGVGLGAVLGTILGVAIYLGLIRFAGKYIFKVSSILLLLLAAGLAAEAAGILTSSGFITTFTEQVWDSSWLINDRSIWGKMLNATVGYNTKPNGMQLIFYVGTILTVTACAKLRNFFIMKRKVGAE